MGGWEIQKEALVRAAITADERPTPTSLETAPRASGRGGGADVGSPANANPLSAANRNNPKDAVRGRTWVLSLVEATGMPYYRFHILGPRGEAMGAVAFDSADDEAAKAHVATLLAGHGGELWRLVPVCEQQGPSELLPALKPVTPSSKWRNRLRQRISRALLR